MSFAKLQALSSLHLIAVLEASRLEEQGDMAGAWDYYRACLRTDAPHSDACWSLQARFRVALVAPRPEKSSAHMVG